MNYSNRGLEFVESVRQVLKKLAVAVRNLQLQSNSCRALGYHAADSKLGGFSLAQAVNSTWQARAIYISCRADVRLAGGLSLSAVFLRIHEYFSCPAR